MFISREKDWIMKLQQLQIFQNLTEEELEIFEKVKKSINQHMKVPCTGCGYCMPCPHGVDIPTCFAAYNTRYTDSFYSGMKAYIMCTTLKTNPTNASKCRQCGKCEKHCPQGIPIRTMLKEAVRELETPKYRVLKWAVKTFRIY